MITIVDYGMGNLGSLKNMFTRIGFSSIIASDVDTLKSAEKLVLPGVGAFDAAMSRISQTPLLLETLNNLVLVKKVPILGICLGMQLMTEKSEEGNLKGLGWIPAETKKFPLGTTLKVPHMGWNLVKPVCSNKILVGIDDRSRYYFVHSYFVKVKNKRYSLMKTNYGFEFDSAIANNNIFGVQFHPEKSHSFGMNLIKNFASL